ncbi:MAG: sulfurtransferase, partial [Nitrospiraceae bacterium]|nr:sulfurtransferase [Nitrospiraceae bacterium]
HLIKPLMIVFLMAAAGFAFAPPVAKARAVPPLVSTGWLARHLGEPGLVVIDVRTASNYGFAHIPGAVSLPYFTGCEVVSSVTMCLLMPTPADFGVMMRALGANQSSYVVIYDHGNTASDATKGASATWVMESMGVRKVSYLDGGFTKWTFEGRKVTKAVPTPQPGNFRAIPDKSRVATLADVIANLKTRRAIFVDDRPAEQHFGVSKESSVPRYGHIPGSLSFPATYMTNAGADRAPATIKSRRELEAMARGTGLTEDKSRPIIVYCNSGQFAGMGYFVLHELLGYRDVKVYDGSMLDYARNKKLPMVRFAWGFVTR